MNQLVLPCLFLGQWVRRSRGGSVRVTLQVHRCHQWDWVPCPQQNMGPVLPVASHSSLGTPGGDNLGRNFQLADVKSKQLMDSKGLAQTDRGESWSQS